MFANTSGWETLKKSKLNLFLETVKCLFAKMLFLLRHNHIQDFYVGGRTTNQILRCWQMAYCQRSKHIFLLLCIAVTSLLFPASCCLLPSHCMLECNLMPKRFADWSLLCCLLPRRKLHTLSRIGKSNLTEAVLMANRKLLTKMKTISLTMGKYLREAVSECYDLWVRRLWVIHSWWNLQKYRHVDRI